METKILTEALLKVCDRVEELERMVDHTDGKVMALRLALVNALKEVNPDSVPKFEAEWDSVQSMIARHTVSSEFQEIRNRLSELLPK